jgi:inner membrane transporter RhtA
VALVVASSFAIQSSAAFSTRLFDELDPLRVAGLRQSVGALALLLLVRPRIRGRPRREWVAIAVLGVSMAGMNVAFYTAVDLLPLGVASTLIYLGPFALAASRTPRGPELALPAIALVGVALVSRPSGDVTLLGVLVGLGSAAGLAIYTLASRQVGRVTTGLDGLALAVGVSGLCLSPAAVVAVPDVPSGQWDIVLFLGLAGVAFAFTCDLAALRLLEARVVATLFALDPVIGVLLGAALLGQDLGALTVVGIGLVAASGAAVTALAQRRNGRAPQQDVELPHG